MYSLGAGTNEIQESWFAWDTIVESKSGRRNTFQTTRITYLQQGNTVGAYYLFCEDFNAYVEGEMSLKLLMRADKPEKE
jgi:hypothetical protein